MINKIEIEKNLPEINIKFNEKLSNYTFTKVGGSADVLAFPKNEDELQKIVKFANQIDEPFLVLGNASNLIIRDGGVRGFVILLEEMNSIEVDGYSIEASAGAILKDVTYVALENSLTGFEFACGIPGSIGGAVYMNAGAYGGEIANILSSCKVMTHAGEILTIEAEDMKFGYRHTVLQDQDYICLSAKFDLSAGDYKEIKSEMERLTHLRELKQPLEYPSCGSVFKRPEGHFAGKLIQDAGVQGHRIGGVEVSNKHAGFMVNVDSGTASDYVNLIAYVQEKVFESSGIHLETEVKILGDDIKL
ncbi:UDP-N-acetylenolpyruvoylglucosamine reductase [Floricoccus penangensis]|uniref:UDP-N-acetylenolpyruvoylglucosamine reductase n=1 Tax=Floricoccus penangensis TaxID=1859475 RepID=A0A9Q5JGB1_9LACT|nr:UDP-N-acetylenolpyruvoylglucosamine reductase [Floricoccus penangensis]